ncbi:MAG: RDD family protein [Planctomycetales bacterium]|nr:RDD family protein [Planctomycetales bacterium]
MRHRDDSLGMGVYYDEADCAGITRRLVASAVDATVLVMFAIVISLVGVATLNRNGLNDTGRNDVWYLMFWLAGGFAYLSALKASRWRTLGYRVAGLKIVTLRGEPPSNWRMSFRLGLAFAATVLVPPLDLFWVGVDNSAQTLRDGFAGTLVVRAGAEPAGTGPIHFGLHMGAGFCLMYPRVSRPGVTRIVPANGGK